MCQPEAIAILNKVYQRCNSVFPNGLKEAYLYGSYACGDFDNESDVDIFLTVDLEPEISQPIGIKLRIFPVTSAWNMMLPFQSL